MPVIIFLATHPPASPGAKGARIRIRGRLARVHLSFFSTRHLTAENFGGKRKAVLPAPREQEQENAQRIFKELYRRLRPIVIVPNFGGFARVFPPQASGLRVCMVVMATAETPP